MERNPLIGTIELEVEKVKVHTFKCQSFKNDHKICDLVWHWSWCAMVWRVMFMTCHGAPSFIAYPLQLPPIDCKTINVGP